MFTEMTDQARNALSDLLDEYENDMFMLTAEHENEGICYHCGELQYGCEPDAEEYECENCGQRAVGGLEMALVNIL